MTKLLVDVPQGSDFPIENLPFGIFSKDSDVRRPGVAIGEYIIDLSKLSQYADLGFDSAVLARPYLNDFIGLGRTVSSDLRLLLQDWLQDDRSPLGRHPDALIEQRLVTMHLPVQVGNYTDFYSSRFHAENVGKLFRDPEKALLPNWEHMPVAYHGRASSVVISGTPVRRPMGQTRAYESSEVTFGPSRELDFELEVAMVVGRNSTLGARIDVGDASEYIFGLLLLNDWSARDIQRWEYRPLGPFLGKSFASTVSPWIVTMDALEPFRVAPQAGQAAVLPYLQKDNDFSLDIDLRVEIAGMNLPREVVVKSNFRHLGWTMSQQIAHHTSNGCNLLVGDLLASGTVSGPTDEGRASLLEISEAGRKPLMLANGMQRTYLEDGDEVILRGVAAKDGKHLGFGEAAGRILPAKQ